MGKRDEAARQRRRRWAFGVTSRGESLAADVAFWRAASASMKFTAIRAMADESEILKGHAPPPGVDRSVGGIRRAPR
jgi:hypothetical protein